MEETLKNMQKGDVLNIQIKVKKPSKVLKALTKLIEKVDVIGINVEEN